MRQHQHHHIALAENEFGTTTVCTDCGTVSLHLPQLSLRLEGAAFHALVNLLQQAQGNMNLLSLTHPEHPAFSASQTGAEQAGATKGRIH